MTGFELNWPRLFIQGQRALQRDPSSFDIDVHGQVEELRITMSHLILAQQKPDQFFGRGLRAKTQSLVFDIGSQALGIHFDGYSGIAIETGSATRMTKTGQRGFRWQMMAGLVFRVISD